MHGLHTSSSCSIMYCWISQLFQHTKFFFNCVIDGLMACLGNIHYLKNNQGSSNSRFGWDKQVY